MATITKGEMLVQKRDNFYNWVVAEKFPDDVQNYVKTLKQMPIEAFALGVAESGQKYLTKGKTAEETSKSMAVEIVESNGKKVADYPEETYKKFERYIYLFIKLVTVD
jgi:hypothetical protein